MAATQARLGCRSTYLAEFKQYKHKSSRLLPPGCAGLSTRYDVMGEGSVKTNRSLYKALNDYVYLV